uniref:uncharacterized protein LOC120329743 n=1 Tax=Styela clava TaxID=7725 RepID=UPI0019394D45|nr:uncharacterized protein LOC120329743 [Styela clava]
MEAGFRTKVVPWRRGASGKLTEYLFSARSHENHVLLVTDSNGRNLVNPQVVRVPKKCKFDLSVVAIPGGRISHGQKELLDGRHFEKLDFLICALGSNNFSNNCQEHTIDILEELESFTAAVQIIYPRVKIVFAKILAQTGRHSNCVGIVNAEIQKYAEKNKPPFSIFRI